MQFVACLSVTYAKFPSELLDTIPLEDLIFLYRVHAVQPFGYRRDEFNTGLLASFIMNSQRASRGAKVWSPLDCMPLSRVNDDLPEDDDERNAAIFDRLVAAQKKGTK